MNRLPSVLSIRIGPDAAKALEDVLDSERRETRDHVLTLASDRFERRLIDEVAQLRVEIAKDRFEILKWMFLFWIGQLAAVSAIIGFLLRK